MPQLILSVSLPMKGVVFDLDETLVDRRGTLDIYSKKLFSNFSDSAVLPQSDFTAAFHRLDNNGRIPRDEFFEAIAATLFQDVPSLRIKKHFEATAWLDPLLFNGILDLLASLRDQGLQIGVITNGGVSSQSAKLGNSGLSKLVDAYVISAAFGLKKASTGNFQPHD